MSTWVNPAYGSHESRRVLRQAATEAESSVFRRARPKPVRPVRRQKVYDLSVDKGLVSRILRRAPKEAGPILRPGVTRQGRVGVEFEHKGVKGWGPNEDAARASWQQNAAMAKKDIDKRDSWEVPMDHFEPALPRRRPNYGSGNTVGKRMTAVGAVTGVAKPKKMQPTRTAPRTAAAAVKMPDMSKPPIAPHLIGKRYVSPAQRSKLAAHGEALPDDSFPMQTRQDVMNARRAIGRTSPAKRPEVRALIARREDALHMAKRDRSHNPEYGRQRRVGAAAAATGIGGALLMGRGIKGVREATHLARRGIKFAPTAGRPAVILEEEGKARRVIPVPERDRIRADDIHRHGITAGRGDLRDIGVGAGLLGSSAGISHYGRSRANREWR